MSEHSDSVSIPDGMIGISLSGGPQDGAIVSMGNGRLPPVLFVGPRWLGDGCAAWGRQRLQRFPVRYRFDGLVFRHDGGD